ncbi:hypothetical protein EYC84_006368 [Monilinia fructicola]|uniref:Uncharacterized protein n=1 Tax=Monilinia fructicola TaxID=38448 RepID=A0A5M9KBB9_MONFR|nr:hypothetical protein EYC84_006368 [Monilinia fructicola]
MPIARPIPVKYKRRQYKGLHQSSFGISHPLILPYTLSESASLLSLSPQSPGLIALVPQPESKTNSENETSSVHSDIRLPQPISCPFLLLEL